MTLYAASSDGTIAVFDFDLEELDGITPHSVQEQYLKKFGFIPPPIPEGFSHDIPSHVPKPSSTRITPPPSPGRGQDQAGPSQLQNGFGHAVNGTGERVNMLVAKRKGPKRIQPTLVSSIPSASTKDPVAADTAAASASVPRSFATDSKSAPFAMLPAPRPQSHTPDPAFRHSSADQSSLESNPFEGDLGIVSSVDMDVPISSLDQNGSVSSILRGKRKAVDTIDDTRTSKPRTLGGDISRGATMVRELVGRTASATTSRLWTESQVDMLPRPPLLTFLSSKMEGSDDVLEVRNPENESELVSHVSH
jgi:protein HIRA/HIR1